MHIFNLKNNAMIRTFISLAFVLFWLGLFSGCLAPWPSQEGQTSTMMYSKTIHLKVTGTDGVPLENYTLLTENNEPVDVVADSLVLQEGALYTLDASWRNPVRFRIDSGLTNLHTLRISLDHQLWSNKSCFDEGRKLKGTLYSEYGVEVEGGIIKVAGRVANTDEEGRYNRCFPVQYDQSQSVFIAKSATSSYRMQMTLVKNGDSDTLLDVFLDDSTDMIDPK